MSTVAVAMSGGLDSSVAAALLLEQGREVIGVTMCLQPPGRNADMVETAASVSRHLGIPHYVVDLRHRFETTVIADFCREYSRGRTPNPCVRCNRFIKLGTLMDWAREQGADMLATGHYARTEQQGERYLIKKARDVQRDQSYFLCLLTQEQLARTLFPLGDLTREEVRDVAGRLGLPVSPAAASQEICFVPDNRHARFVQEYTGAGGRPGPVLDRQGRVIGEHRGIAAYTIGQRRGLRIAARGPLYVVDMDAARNTITVGSRWQLYATGLVASGLNWVSVDRPEGPIRVRARIRYRHAEAAAVVVPGAATQVEVTFERLQMAITPGQAVVFYAGDMVVGGGTIDRVIPLESPPH